MWPAMRNTQERVFLYRKGSFDCCHSCALMVDSSLDIGSNWRKNQRQNGQCSFVARALLPPPKIQWRWTSESVMWCYHRWAFLLDSMVCNYSIVPDGDQTAGLRSIEEVERKVQQRLLLLAWLMWGVRMKKVEQTGIFRRPLPLFVPQGRRLLLIRIGNG